MGLALFVTAAATLWIGIFPNAVIQTVDGVLGLRPASSVAQLVR
jgi:hypothetical protein